ncbi:MAG: HAD family phosphatase [Alphaproteobacteria bacterium]|nr:HAD family phosphatase [Alphaproteobacteria bacterium]MBU1515504.1 HAD family phosphatase [Alphaproteobacteria bacterium]MBU2095502.1 HAD family phosphatase [Alphaproteobacteria bacterium]MBU2150743.1 HAD family phosphatase [Alphaproteobacteria bacterium]MBU2307008.1 HAD family phosphatase [Alphaproteobacteria bacterium]
MPLPRPVKAVVFDMDGLLVDTETVVFRAMTRAAGGIGGEMPFATFQRMVGLQHAHSDPILIEHFGAGFDLDAWQTVVSAHFREELSGAGIALKAGVVEILDRLDELGLPRAIATSSGLESVRASLGPHSLIDRFHALITRDVQTRGKPHPEPFLKAAEALGVDPADCLALEDSHNGVRSASAAGMMTVMVPDMLDPTEEMETLCVRIARDLHEVRGWLDAQPA